MSILCKTSALEEHIKYVCQSWPADKAYAGALTLSVETGLCAVRFLENNSSDSHESLEADPEKSAREVNQSQINSGFRCLALCMGDMSPACSAGSRLRTAARTLTAMPLHFNQGVQ